MKWVVVILLVVGLALIAVGVAGKVGGGRLPSAEIVSDLLDAAADQPDQDKADDLMARVAALDEESAALEARVRTLTEKAFMRDPSPEEAAAALPLLADAMAALDEAKKNRESVATLWGRVARLDVGEELKTYAGLMKDLGDLTARQHAAMRAFTAKHEFVYRRMGTFTKADLERQYQKIGDLARGVEESDALAAKKWEECRQYYRDHFE